MLVGGQYDYDEDSDFSEDEDGETINVRSIADHPLLAGKKTKERVEKMRQEKNLRNEQRKPCELMTFCTDKSKDHQRAFSHVGDEDYALAMQLHATELQPQFLTIMQMFQWADPFGTGFIDSHVQLQNLFFALGRGERPQAERSC